MLINTENAHEELKAITHTNPREWFTVTYDLRVNDGKYEYANVSCVARGTARNGQVFRILKASEVTQITGLSYSAITMRVKAGTFPQPVKLTARNIGWREDEVSEWINKLQKRS